MSCHLPLARLPRTPASTSAARGPSAWARAAGAAACWALAAGAASSLAAGIHKCVDPAGSVTYSGLPCPPGQAMSADPLPPLGIVTMPRPAPAEGRRSGGSTAAGDARASRWRTAGATSPAGSSPPRRAAGARARSRDASAGTGSVRTRADAGRASERRFVSVGMSDVEVLTRLGKPDRVLGAVASPTQARRGPRGAGERWLYLPAAGDSETITVVVIERGQVVDVDRRISR